MSDEPPFKRALVVKLRHHGDVLLTTPVFGTLARLGIEVDALIYDETRDMLALNPHLRAIHCIGREWRTLGAWQRLRRYRALYAALKRRNYDLLVHLTDHWHGAWLARYLEPRCSVAPAVTRASAGANRLWARSFTHRFPLLPGNRRHTVEMHLDALRRVGMQPDASDKVLHFEPGEAARASVAAKLAATGVARDAYIVIHPTSRWLFKCWPQRQTADLIDSLRERGETIVLSAAPDASELDWLAALKLRLARAVIDLSGQLGIKELGALIGGARLFVGVDSMPMHLAAALGTPTVALFGPSGDIEWGPWNVPHRVVKADIACRPCGFAGCGDGNVSDCLAMIAPSTVLAAIDALDREQSRP